MYRVCVPKSVDFSFDLSVDLSFDEPEFLPEFLVLTCPKPVCCLGSPDHSWACFRAFSDCFWNGVGVLFCGSQTISGLFLGIVLGLPDHVSNGFGVRLGHFGGCFEVLIDHFWHFWVVFCGLFQTISERFWGCSQTISLAVFGVCFGALPKHFWPVFACCFEALPPFGG